jgi:hypothetical protein
MNNTEKVLMGLLSLVLLAVIVVAIVMLVKKNDPGARTGYQLIKDGHWTGNDLDPDNDSAKFKYSTQIDKTNGVSNYKLGSQSKLIQVDKKTGRTKITVGQPDGTTTIPTVFIKSKDTFNHGLFVMSVDHIPTGKGVWPAWWLNGRFPPESNDTWALNGEIDIIESVNSQTKNHVTLHTNTRKGGQQCRQDTVHNIVNPNCDKGEFTGCGEDRKQSCPYQGCGVTFEGGANYSAGGVYACELTKDGKVTVWYFSKGSQGLPEGLDEASKGGGDIDVSKWKALATNTVEFQKCPGSFQNMEMIVNTAFCGDWAGTTFDVKNPKNSKEECNKFVLDTNNSKNLENAYWDINWIRVYQQK